MTNTEQKRKVRFCSCRSKSSPLLIEIKGKSIVFCPSCNSRTEGVYGEGLAINEWNKERVT